MNISSSLIAPPINMAVTLMFEQGISTVIECRFAFLGNDAIDCAAGKAFLRERIVQSVADDHSVGVR